MNDFLAKAGCFVIGLLVMFCIRSFTGLLQVLPHGRPLGSLVMMLGAFAIAALCGAAGATQFLRRLLAK